MNIPPDSGPYTLPDIMALHMAAAEIKMALNAKPRLYYLALISTLSLIDLCAAMEATDGKTDKHKFMAWYRKYLGPHYQWLSAQDCYGLRCGLIHKGSMSHEVKDSKGNSLPPSRWKRIAFLLTDTVGAEIRGASSGDVYMTGLPEFCLDVLKRVEEWAVANRQNPVAHENSKKQLRLYPAQYPTGPAWGSTSFVKIGIPALA